MADEPSLQGVRPVVKDVAHCDLVELLRISATAAVGQRELLEHVQPASAADAAVAATCKLLPCQTSIAPEVHYDSKLTLYLNFTSI